MIEVEKNWITKAGLRAVAIKGEYARCGYVGVGMKDVKDFGELVRKEFQKRRLYKTVWVPILWDVWWKPWAEAKQTNQVNKPVACKLEDKRELRIDDLYLREAIEFEELMYGEESKVGVITFATFKLD